MGCPPGVRVSKRRLPCGTTPCTRYAPTGLAAQRSVHEVIPLGVELLVKSALREIIHWVEISKGFRGTATVAPKKKNASHSMKLKEDLTVRENDAKEARER